MKHTENCNCPICNNDIREERQYAALELKDGSYVTLDAQEFVHLDDWMQNRKKGEEHPQFEKVEPDEDTPLQLVYGVLMPADTKVKEDYVEKAKEIKNYALVTLEDEKVYYSGYQDIEVFEGKEIYSGCIPCAMLLQTSLDLEDKLEYGFGHTMFLKYTDWNIFDNIFNRKFLFCVRDVEPNFKPEDEEHWKDYINVDSMLDTAKELF